MKIMNFIHKTVFLVIVTLVSFIHLTLMMFQYSMKIAEDIQRNEEKRFLSSMDNMNIEDNNDKDDDITLQE